MVLTSYFLQLHVMVLEIDLFDSVICTILFRKRHRQTLSAATTITLGLEVQWTRSEMYFNSSLLCVLV